MKITNIPFLAILTLAACSTPEAPPAAPPPAKDTVVVKPTVREAVMGPANSAIKLVVAPPATQFPDAVLKLDTVVPNAKKLEAMYKFKVNGFDLKAQTPDAATRGCANSKDGQHIHFILNNAPYKAEYTSDFTEKANPGRNVALCFLSRSYHESLKHNSAVVVKQFTMPGKDSLAAGDVMKDPTLFYSRPKGDYKQIDGDKILLDFYLLNTDLDKDGYSVKATIDGEDWTINKWDAYFIEGLQLGKHTVRLQLMDASGKPVPGPFNDSGVREFNFLGS
ncbi:MAG: phosphopeptide-binding protein [Flavobacteriales bacterium]|nr:phosphopeptide-binding protein [Flavobacteriales bacterium]